MLGQALVGLGQNQEGIQALNTFLQESPQNPMAKQVRDLIVQVQERASSPTPAANTPTARSATLRHQQSGVASSARALGETVAAASIDDVKLALAPGVACPADKVIEESGRRVQELVQDVTRFSAVEDLFHQPLDEFGNAHSHRNAAI